MMPRPKWWPENPYPFHTDELGHRLAWEEGVEAMAKALVEHIEAELLAQIDPNYRGTMPWPEHWRQIRREVGLDEDDLPTPAEMRGLVRGMTEGKLSEDYVRELWEKSGDEVG